MTDEDVSPRGPERGEGDAPRAETAGRGEDSPRLDDPPTAETAPPDPGTPPPGSGASAASDTGARPAGGYAAAPPPQPSGAAAFTYRYGLVRPRQGRYLAGVCAAVGRATNTDPVLWRVLLAVLGFFGGIGILVYVAAWLIIPAEGDSASPVESMLGRGRSSMSPVTVLVLSVIVAAMFGYIVTDGFRAVLLGVAILIGGALLLNRDTTRAPTGPATATFTGPPFSGPPPAGAPTAGYGQTPGPPDGGTAAYGTYGGTAAYGGTSAYAAGPVTPADPTGVPHPGYHPAQATTAGAPYPGHPHVPGPAGAEVGPVDQPLTSNPPGGWPPPPGTPSAPSAGPPPWSADYPPPGPQPGAAFPINPAPMPPGYRPPFAPRGPYAGPYPPGGFPPGRLPPGPSKPPKRPRERSPLGAATFSMIFVALGLVAILDLANAVRISPSTYFAAVLMTIALGLLVGAWFGRARWLIALGLVGATALGIATLAESIDHAHHRSGTVNWTPVGYEAVTDRYEARFGDAVLDLRQVDFTDRDRQITVRMDFGQLRVVLPPDVDTTVLLEVRAGDANVFGSRWNGFSGPSERISDLGADGVGGGTLRLHVYINAGNAEVHR